MSRMQEQITKQPPKTFAGIDVGKDYLDIFIHPIGVQMQIKNDKSAIKALIKRLTEHDIELVALEATSKYHRLTHSMLHDAGIVVAVINPFRSRQFADSLGRLAKTDTIDAKSLALFAQRMNPEPTLPPDTQCRELRDLQTARRQVLDEICDLKRQLHTTDHPLAVRQIKARIAMGERHKSVLEKEIHTLIASQPDLKNKFDILTSIPGIGKTTASILLADMAELGQVNAKEIAALAGVAPMNWDSGIKNGNRMIRGGRKHVRNALYMCSITCIRRSNSLGLTYKNLVRRGKNPKVALTAVMRKMIIIANTLIAENRKWQIECPC
ncbi:MAG: IS110 family transposase [Alphaproteobacteria bacterium]